MSAKSKSTVKATWKAGNDEINIEARGYKTTIFEPVTHSCASVPGVNAMEYYLGSLAACMTTITKWHASKAGVANIDEITINVSAEIDTRACFTGDTNIKPGPSAINFEVYVKSPDDVSKLQKAFELGENLCPIADATKNPTKINLVVKNSP